MANTKISLLTFGNPALTGDLIPIDRSGSNFSITAGSIASLPLGAAAATSLALTDTAPNIDFSMTITTAATSVASQSSPIESLSGTYWTGAASAADTWTQQTVETNGTNGLSVLTFAHAGSPNFTVQFPNGGNFTAATVGSYGLQFGTTMGIGNRAIQAFGAALSLQPGGGSVTAGGSILAGSSSSFSWTGKATGFTSPSSGNIDFGNGGATDVSANLFAASLSLGAPTGGNEGAGTVNVATGYYTNGSAGVSAGSFSAITAITTVGGIVTQLTGTSDERLKDSTPYEGGLDAILSIHPVRYKWNEAGQKHTGLSGEQEFVGFLAQDVQKAIPQAITATEGQEQYLSFDPRPIIAALVNAVKTLENRVRELESE